MQNILAHNLQAERKSRNGAFLLWPAIFALSACPSNGSEITTTTYPNSLSFIVDANDSDPDTTNIRTIDLSFYFRGTTDNTEYETSIGTINGDMLILNLENTSYFPIDMSVLNISITATDGDFSAAHYLRVSYEQDVIPTPISAAASVVLANSDATAFSGFWSEPGNGVVDYTLVIDAKTYDVDDGGFFDTDTPLNYDAGSTLTVTLYATDGDNDTGKILLTLQNAFNNEEPDKLISIQVETPDDLARTVGDGVNDFTISLLDEIPDVSSITSVKFDDVDSSESDIEYNSSTHIVAFDLLQDDKPDRIIIEYNTTGGTTSTYTIAINAEIDEPIEINALVDTTVTLNIGDTDIDIDISTYFSGGNGAFDYFVGRAEAGYGNDVSTNVLEAANIEYREGGVFSLLVIAEDSTDTKASKDQAAVTLTVHNAVHTEYLTPIANATLEAITVDSRTYLKDLYIDYSDMFSFGSEVTGPDGNLFSSHPLLTTNTDGLPDIAGSVEVKVYNPDTMTPEQATATENQAFLVRTDHSVNPSGDIRLRVNLDPFGPNGKELINPLFDVTSNYTDLRYIIEAIQPYKYVRNEITQTATITSTATLSIVDELLGAPIVAVDDPVDDLYTLFSATDILAPEDNISLDVTTLFQNIRAFDVTGTTINSVMVNSTTLTLNDDYAFSSNTLDIDVTKTSIIDTSDADVLAFTVAVVVEQTAEFVSYTIDSVTNAPSTQTITETGTATVTYIIERDIDLELESDLSVDAEFKRITTIYLNDFVTGGNGLPTFSIDSDSGYITQSQVDDSAVIIDGISLSETPATQVMFEFTATEGDEFGGDSIIGTVTIDLIAPTFEAIENTEYLFLGNSNFMLPTQFLHNELAGTTVTEKGSSSVVTVHTFAVTPMPASQDFAVTSGGSSGFATVTVQALGKIDDVATLTPTPSAATGAAVLADASIKTIHAQDGDLDGDGFADILYTNNSSELVLRYGAARGVTAKVATLVPGTGSFDSMNAAFTRGSDINGDGFGDLAIAFIDDDGADAIYVVSGALARLTGSVTLADNATAFAPPAADDDLGSAMAFADVNSDGLADLILGAPNRNAPFDPAAGGIDVYYGGGDLSSLFSGSADTVIAPPDGAAGLKLGQNLLAVGDGKEDFLATIPNEQLGDGLGAVYLLSGTSPTLSASLLRGGYEINGGNTQGLGAVHAAGDINGDGLADIVLTEQQGDDQLLLIYLGSASMDEGLDRARVADINLRFSDDPDSFSVTALSSGDINGDGFDDLIFAKTATGGTTDSYALFGQAEFATPAVTTVFSNNGTKSESLTVQEAELDTLLETGGFKITGTTAMAAGDIDGDGFDDLLAQGYIIHGGPFDQTTLTGSHFINNVTLASDATAASGGAGADTYNVTGAALPYIRGGGGRDEVVLQGSATYTLDFRAGEAEHGKLSSIENIDATGAALVATFDEDAVVRMASWDAQQASYALAIVTDGADDTINLEGTWTLSNGVNKVYSLGLAEITISGDATIVNDYS